LAALRGSFIGRGAHGYAWLEGGNIGRETNWKKQQKKVGDRQTSSRGGRERATASLNRASIEDVSSIDPDHRCGWSACTTVLANLPSGRLRMELGSIGLIAFSTQGGLS